MCGWSESEPLPGPSSSDAAGGREQGVTTAFGSFLIAAGLVGPTRVLAWEREYREQIANTSIETRTLDS